MAKWECKVVLPKLEVDLARLKGARTEESAEVDSIAKVLNRYGREGWEFVAVDTSVIHVGQPVAYLKRRAK